MIFLVTNCKSKLHGKLTFWAAERRSKLETLKRRYQICKVAKSTSALLLPFKLSLIDNLIYLIPIIKSCLRYTRPWTTTTRTVTWNKFGNIAVILITNLVFANNVYSCTVNAITPFIKTLNAKIHYKFTTRIKCTCNVAKSVQQNRVKRINRFVKRLGV